MGRTNPTYRDVLRSLEDDWSDYRRALRRQDQQHFDHLFEHARNYADAAGYLNHPEPMIPVLVSIALAQEQHLSDLRDRIDAIEDDLTTDRDASTELELS
jgi:hypothetical protein